MRFDETGSDGEENSREDGKSFCNDDEEFMPSQWDLQNKKWYWGNTSKETLAIAMQVF